jgi:radical SAM superfamily enzyme YgiQ (UPF0313 family)
MKILFVWPEFEKGGFKPMGIALLSAILARHGHQRRLFDTSIYDIPLMGRVNDVEQGERQLLFPPTTMPPEAHKHIDKDFITAFNEELDAYRPDLVAFSCSSMSYLIVKRMVEGMRTEGPRPALAMGGIHALSYTDDVVADALFDYVCLGEGEDAVLHILEHLEGRRAADDVPNVYVLQDGAYVKNAPGPMLTDLDSLPYFDWSLFEDYHFWRPYQGTAYRMGDFQTSRGCPYRCLYCFYNTFFAFYKDSKKRLRFYSNERAVDELAEHTARHGLGFWKLHDSDAFLRGEDDFCDLMDRYAARVGLPFVCNSNANSLTRRKVRAAARAGCRSISLGVETGREDLRKQALQKNVSNQAIIEAVRLCKEEGVRVCTSNMLGLPGETEEDIRETIRLNREAAPDLAEPTFFYPFKGTELGNYCHEQGFVRQTLEESLVNLRSTSVMEMPQIAAETLEGLYRAFPLYMKLPEWLDPVIRLAEEPGPCGEKAYQALHDILARKLAEERGETAATGRGA